MKSLFTFRNIFEIIALPFFALLVIHMAGHGAMLLFDHDHSHEQHIEEGEEEHHDQEGYEDEHGFMEMFFSEEGLFGVLFLFMFVWLWNRPFLKKWVPCQHEHCHSETIWAHLSAIAAFCLHFFPEAGIRSQLLSDFALTDFLSIATIFGFLSHFLVDVIVMISLALYFSSLRDRIFGFVGMIILWIFAFFIGEHLFDFLPSSAESVLYLLSAFLLAMFVHFPHKEKACGSCHHH